MRRCSLFWYLILICIFKDDNTFLLPSKLQLGTWRNMERKKELKTLHCRNDNIRSHHKCHHGHCCYRRYAVSMALRGLRICVLRVQNHFSGYRHTAMQGVRRKHTVPTDSVYSTCVKHVAVWRRRHCVLIVHAFTHTHMHMGRFKINAVHTQDSGA